MLGCRDISRGAHANSLNKDGWPAGVREGCARSNPVAKAVAVQILTLLSGCLVLLYLLAGGVFANVVFLLLPRAPVLKPVL